MKAALLVLSISWLIFAQETVLIGIPEKKVTVDAFDSKYEEIKNDKAIAYRCVITKINGDYYWTSRENVPLAGVSNGSFPTFCAVNGSGIIKILKPEDRKDAIILKGKSSLITETEDKYEYVEIILHGLKTVMYYGKFSKINSELLPK
jgi:hypothetical protein